MLLLYYTFFHNNFHTLIHWILLSCCILSSAIISVLLRKKFKIGVAVLSAFHGCILGLLISTAVWLKWSFAFYILLISFAVCCFMASFVAPDFSMISSTSLIGSYLMIRAVGLFGGSTWYPNEFALAGRLNSGTDASVPLTFYIFGAVIFLVYGIGLFMQKNTLSNEKSVHFYYL